MELKEYWTNKTNCHRVGSHIDLFHLEYQEVPGWPGAWISPLYLPKSNSFKISLKNLNRPNIQLLRPNRK